MTELTTAYRRGKNAVSIGSDDQNDLETEIADTLANIMHYCKAEAIDFEVVLSRARDYFVTEIVEWEKEK